MCTSTLLVTNTYVTWQFGFQNASVGSLYVLRTAAVTCACVLCFCILNESLVFVKSNDRVHGYVPMSKMIILQ